MSEPGRPGPPQGPAPPVAQEDPAGGGGPGGGPPARSLGTNVRVALLVLSGIGLLAILAGMEVFHVSKQTVAHQATLERSIEQRGQIRQAFSMLLAAEGAQRAFMLTADAAYERQFWTAERELSGTLDRLLDNLRDRPEALSLAQALATLANARMGQLANVLADSGLAEHAPAAPSGTIIPQSRSDVALRTVNRLRQLSDRMIADAEREIRDASRALSDRIRLSRTITIILIGGIVVMVTFVVTLGLAYLLHRGRVETELHEAMAVAQQASEAKAQFLASMSHEIRTPLTSILGYTDLLLEEGLNGQQRVFVEHLQIAGQGLAALVDDILELSKIEAGETALEEAPLSLGTLVANVLLIVSLSAQRKGLELRNEIGPALPAMVLGDEPRLRQVLLNLLTNAIKFTPRGAVTVRVELQGRAEAGEIIRFEVSDTGIGIAADRQHRLFQRFSQADASIQHEYGGTGLGLAISKKHVELMQGEIGFESVAGRGSTFWFRVPLPRSLAPQAQPASEGATPAAADGRILLAEDSRQSQDLVCAILRWQGHHVDVVSNGEDAVSAAGSQAYDLILMDIQMPHMDGMAAARRIRAMSGPAGRLPVIAMSANVLPQQRRAFREAGMDDHIAKPFTRSELIGKVSQWIAAPAGQAAAAAAPGADTAPDDSPPDDSPLEDSPLDEQALEALRELMGGVWVRISLARLCQRIADTFPEPANGPPDRAHLKRHTHRIVSDAGQLGLRDLSQACRDLEVACAGGEEIGPTLARARRAAAQASRTCHRLLARADLG